MERFKVLALKWKLLILIMAISYIGMWVIVGYFWPKNQNQSSTDKAENKFSTLIKEEQFPQAASVVNPINGLFYTEEESAAWKSKTPLAIMVENSILARPQSGLGKADLVYEALAEGDITRFAAIFLANTSQVGPVRSARDYYYDWIKEYQPAYGHWGGNNYARNLARQIFGAKDLDQFAIGSAAYYRIGSGEHSGYTHTDKLWAVSSSRGVNTFTPFSSWLFKEDLPSNQPTAQEISVPFNNSPGYVVVWRYDRASNSYKRFNAGSAHVDKETGQQITAKTVIVQTLKSFGYKQVSCCPPVLNRSFETIGSGPVKIFRDGVVIEGAWKKTSRYERTKFFDSAGKEIALNRGLIWLEMIPNYSNVSYK